jgi:periplasmic protein TonB
MTTRGIHVPVARVIAAMAALAALGSLLHSFLETNTARTAPPVQALNLVAPVPPPPPPPEPKPVEEAHPEPISRLDTKDWMPAGPATASAPSAAPASGPLGLDEAGGSGSDAFGLAGRPGGRELLLTGEGGGGGANGRYLHFAGQLQSFIQTQLNERASLRKACYQAAVEIRVGPTGSIEEVKIRESSGDRTLDNEIRTALLQLSPADVPPADMPWPVGLRLVSQRVDCNGRAAEQ